MFQLLCVFGPASVTYSLVRRILSRDTVSFFDGLIEFVCYATLDSVITMVVLIGFGRLEFLIMPNGIRNFQYIGIASLVFAIIVAVIVGVAISIVKKHIDVTIEAELRDNGDTHGSEKNN